MAGIRCYHTITFITFDKATHLGYLRSEIKHSSEILKEKLN